MEKQDKTASIDSAFVLDQKRWFTSSMIDEKPISISSCKEDIRDFLAERKIVSRVDFDRLNYTNCSVYRLRVRRIDGSVLHRTWKFWSDTSFSWTSFLLTVAAIIAASLPQNRSLSEHFSDTREIETPCHSRPLEHVWDPIYKCWVSKYSKRGEDLR